MVGKVCALISRVLTQYQSGRATKGLKLIRLIDTHLKIIKQCWIKFPRPTAVYRPQRFLSKECQYFRISIGLFGYQSIPPKGNVTIFINPGGSCGASTLGALITPLYILRSRRHCKIGEYHTSKLVPVMMSRLKTNKSAKTVRHHDRFFSELCIPANGHDLLGKRLARIRFSPITITVS